MNGTNQPNTATGSPVKAVTLHGQKKGRAVALEEGAISLGAERDVKESDVQDLIASLARMGIDSSHITYSLEPSDPERKRTQKPGDPPPASDEGARHFTLHLKNLHHLGDKQGITDETLLQGLRQDGLINETEQQRQKEAAEQRNRGFVERLTKEGPGSAITHLYNKAAVTLVGAMYVFDDSVGLAYSHLLNRQTLAKRGIGDLGLSLMSLIGSTTMMLWGNTRSKKSNEEKEMVRYREAIKRTPYGQTLTDGVAETPDERTGGERFREFMEANAAKVGTGGNAFSTLFIAKAAADQKDPWRWAQFATASAGFTLSTMSSKEGVAFEDSRMGKFINSNPVTGVLEKPARGLFSFLQNRPYASVALVMLYNLIGMKGGWENRQRSEPERERLRKEFGDERYQRITGVSVDEETGEVTLLTHDKPEDRDWWNAVDNKKGNELDKGVDELRTLVSIRGSGWAVRDSGSGELRPPTKEELSFLQLHDMRDAQGNPLTESVRAGFEARLAGQDVHYTPLGAASDPDQFRHQNHIVAEQSGNASGQVEFFRLEPKDRVDESAFHTGIVDYQMFERLRDYSWLFIAKNVWMFITNGLFALAPKPDSRIDPEAQTSLIAMDILDAIQEGLEAGLTDNELRQQSLERMHFAVDYFAQLPAMQYAAQQGLIATDEHGDIRPALEAMVNNMAKRMAPLTDRSNAMQVWEVIYNDHSTALSDHYARERGASPEQQLTQNLQREQARELGIGYDGASLVEQQPTRPNEFAPEAIAVTLQEMRANPDNYSRDQIAQMESQLLQSMQVNNAEAQHYVN